MMRVMLRLGGLALALLLGGATARGATLYVNRFVTADPGDVSLGDLLRASGSVPAGAQETLARSVAVLSDKVLIIPTGVYREQVKDAFGVDSILVGSRSIVVPRGGPAAGETYLLDRLADYLAAQGLVSDAKVELTFMPGPTRGTPPVDGEPVFQLQKNGRAGPEISFSLAGSGGSSISGRVGIGGATPVMLIASGTAVQVVFHKGPITIETPGKSLGVAGPGETVSVLLTDSQKTVTARVLDGKAVTVDLP
jgi:hypothetical protein